MKVEIESKFEVGDVVYSIELQKEYDTKPFIYWLWGDRAEFVLTAVQANISSGEITYCGEPDAKRWSPPLALEKNAFKTFKEAKEESIKRNVVLRNEFQEHIENIDSLKEKIKKHEEDIGKLSKLR